MCMWWTKIHILNLIRIAIFFCGYWGVGWTHKKILTGRAAMSWLKNVYFCLPKIKIYGNVLYNCRVLSSQSGRYVQTIQRILLPPWKSPVKCWYFSTRLPGITSHKTVIAPSVVSAVRTSHPTCWVFQCFY